MTKIKSRIIGVYDDVQLKGLHESINAVDPAVVKAIKIALAEEVAAELDELVDKLNDFLEIRIKAEFDELREDFSALMKDIETAHAIASLGKAIAADATSEIFYPKK